MDKDEAVNQSSHPRPALTGTAHTLPFEKLSPRDFERLCLWLVESEGYEDAEHLGAAGSEQGRDLVAWRDGVEWGFQCKRVQRFGPSDAVKEAEKVLDLPPDERPAGLIFLVTCDVSARTRQEVRRRCGDELTSQFWTGTELDRRVKRHPDIVAEFFDAGAPASREQQPTTGEEPGIQATHGAVVQIGSGNTAFTGPIQGGVHIGQGGVPVEHTSPARAKDYNIAAIRDLLLDAFTADDLHRLFLYTDNAELRPLIHELAKGDGLSPMIEKTLRFCQSRALFSDLLSEVERKRPRQYRRYAHLLHL